MHEASIAQSLIEIVDHECLVHGYPTVRTINIAIGKMSGVMPEALTFSFDALKAGTKAAAATITISVIPIAGSCTSCRKEFTADDNYVLTCPFCDSPEIAITSGRELDIVDMEVDD